MVLLGGVAATIRAGAETIEAAPELLTIVPPGPSEVVAKGAGHLVRVLSNRAADLLAKADNAATYADGAGEVAPLVSWPDPPGGFKLRNYKPFDYDKPDTNMRLFRCTNLMINVLTKRTAPRDVKKLSPHAHDDFEQASLLLEGDYIHHLRYPWVPDMSQWRPDEHLEIASPSVIVIPHQGRAYEPQYRRQALLADRHLRPAAARLLAQAGIGAQCRRIPDACGIAVTAAFLARAAAGSMKSVHMKSVHVRAPGGPEVLSLVERRYPRRDPARC